MQRKKGRHQERFYTTWRYRSITYCYYELSHVGDLNLNKWMVKSYLQLIALNVNIPSLKADFCNSLSDANVYIYSHWNFHSDPIKRLIEFLTQKNKNDQLNSCFCVSTVTAIDETHWGARLDVIVSSVKFVHIKTTNPKLLYPFKSISMFSNGDMKTVLLTQYVWKDLDVWIMHPRGQPVRWG